MSQANAVTGGGVKGRGGQGGLLGQPTGGRAVCLQPTLRFNSIWLRMGLLAYMWLYMALYCCMYGYIAI